MSTSNLLEKTVSVIIPTKNSERTILECLSSLFNQSLQSVEPLEVIIVDGGSIDLTLKIARQFPVKIINEVGPASLPNARNLGIKNAKGEILLIMDSDVVLDKDCIKTASKRFEDSKILAVIPSEQIEAHSHLEKIQIEWLRGTANPYRMGIGISSFAEFFRKRVFKKINFDPNLGFGEDDDFQQRFERLFGDSEKIVNSRDSKIYVHYPHTFGELLTQCTWYGRTFKTYLKKHPSLKAILIAGSLLAPAILIVLVFLSIFFVLAFPFLILVSVLLVARNLIACYRSKSTLFFEFIGFEFLRSIFFVIGIVQSFFSRKRGK